VYAARQYSNVLLPPAADARLASLVTGGNTNAAAVHNTDLALLHAVLHALHALHAQSSSTLSLLAVVNIHSST
jgi:hypothetical protein